MRFNDGAVDSQGRFWAGMMNDHKVQEPIDEGVLFRLDPDGKMRRMIEKVSIPNGIGWNHKDYTMFFTDSPTKNIYAFDFDSVTGTLSNRRVFFHLDDDVGVPDGFAIDEEGYLWSAVYNGSKVIRISPEGKVVGEILLPTQHITCPVFVGEDLFITSAADSESDNPQSRKFGGSLFRVKVGVKGKPKNKFRLAID
jgi:sugar lactone lactonase YvrE